MPQVAGHAAKMFRVLSDPAIYQFENQPPASQEWLAQRFAFLETRKSPDGNQQWLNWVVQLADENLAGYVQATVLPNGCGYVAYELNSRFWRQGLGSSAVAAVLEELGSAYGVHTVAAVLKAANFRSTGLLVHLGFLPASPAQAKTFPCEPDEKVMVKLVGEAPANRSDSPRKSNNMEDHQLLEHLQALEEELLRDPSRSSPVRLTELLSADFVEFGGSGRVFDRETMIASLVDWESTTVHAVFDFKLLRLAADSALVTYRIESRSPDGQPMRESLRSSLWIIEAGSWVVRFHQGTRKS